MSAKLTRDDEFATNFAKAREAAGMSREQVADALGPLGYAMHHSAIGKIERRERRVTVGEAEALATVVARSLNELLGAAWRVDLLHRTRRVQEAANEVHGAVVALRREQWLLAITAAQYAEDLAGNGPLRRDAMALLGLRPEQMVDTADIEATEQLKSDRRFVRNDEYLAIYSQNLLASRAEESEDLAPADQAILSEETAALRNSAVTVEPDVGLDLLPREQVLRERWTVNNGIPQSVIDATFAELVHG